MKKYFLKYCLIITIFFSWGYFSHRNNFFPGNLIKKIFSIELFTIIKYELFEKSANEKAALKPIILRYYNQNELIFSDRKYINNPIADINIKGFTLIQIPRHYEKKIIIKIFKPLTIYRVLCELNNNKIYENWEKASFNLDIKGTKGYCTHKKVVKKYFLPQTLSLPPGGPISADPIFIDENITFKKKFQIL